MDHDSQNLSSLTSLPEPDSAPGSLAADERGQISVLVVLSLIPFVLLVAFIFNTAKQTTRKIEMQGAADSAAVATAVTMARGMNLMVLNNNGMADILALMILVRSMANTAAIMYYLNEGLAAIITIPPLVAYFKFLAQLWSIQKDIWGTLDDIFNREYGGWGWVIMRMLDGFNALIKVSFPAWAIYQAAAYAKKNLANQFPYGFVLPGATAITPIKIGGFSVQLPVPTFPVARGPKETIAERVRNCQFGPVHMLAALLFAPFILDPIQVVVAEGIYFLLADANIAALGGGSPVLDRIVRSIRSLFGKIFDDIFDFLGPFDFLFSWVGDVLGYVFGILGEVLGIKLLLWSNTDADNPHPMLLSEEPQKGDTDQKNAEASDKLRAYLQYLGFALGKVPRGSPIGGERFLNQPNEFSQVQFTYGQANVYNPLKWDMWTQDWRAQLTRAKLFDSKVNSLIQILGGLDEGVTSSPGDKQWGINWSFVNAH